MRVGQFLHGNLAQLAPGPNVRVAFRRTYGDPLGPHLHRIQHGSKNRLRRGQAVVEARIGIIDRHFPQDIVALGGILLENDRRHDRRGSLMVVVDTSILASLYLPGDRVQEVERLLRRDAHWTAPALWRSELLNVLCTYPP